MARLTSTGALDAGFAASGGASGSVYAIAIFSVGATGMPLNYSWFDNGVLIPGQTTAVLTFAAVDPTNAGSYVCKVSNYLNAVTPAPVLTLASFTSQGPT